VFFLLGVVMKLLNLLKLIRFSGIYEKLKRWRRGVAEQRSQLRFQETPRLETPTRKYLAIRDLFFAIETGLSVAFQTGAPALPWFPP
jgi:hypothetical protein